MEANSIGSNELGKHELTVKLIQRPFNYDGNPSVDILFKDEATWPSESHYHRSFWSLIMWALWQGHLTRGNSNHFTKK